MEEHPINQAIQSIEIPDGADSFCSYTVGQNCTRIEATFKSGLHANMPYIRVWRDDVALAEFCQHNIVGVYFSAERLVLPKSRKFRSPND